MVIVEMVLFGSAEVVVAVARGCRGDMSTALLLPSEFLPGITYPWQTSLDRLNRIREVNQDRL